MKTAIVLLTWKRIGNLKLTLNMLQKQTNKNFDVFISNGNLEERSRLIVERYAKSFPKLNIEVSHDGNDQFTFRRFTKGRELAKRGYEVIMYLDDDVTIGQQYVDKALSQYEPRSYKSGYAWKFLDNGGNYYKKRYKVFNKTDRVHYCGTGVSMIDASIFLNKELFNAPEGADKIEDLWLSYFVDSQEGWSNRYMDVGDITIRGADDVALFKQVGGSPLNKAVFLRKLVDLGWDLSS
jgi:glycosyltransferase involved in cell wall biosynthesis